MKQNSAQSIKKVFKDYRFTAGLILCVGITFSFLIFRVIRKIDESRAQAQFIRKAENKFHDLEASIKEKLFVLQSVKAFYDSSNEIKRDEFATCVRPFLKNIDGIKAIEWVPRVSHKERSEYEIQAREDGHEDYQITELDKNGDIIRAPERDEYYPTYYIQPYLGNHKDLGFNKASESIRFMTMLTARDTGKAVATKATVLVQDSENSDGFLVFAPVYRKDGVDFTLSGRRESIKGFVVGVFEVCKVVNSASTKHSDDKINLEVYDTTDGDSQCLYSYKSEGIEIAPGSILESSYNTKVASRNWQIKCVSSKSHFTEKIWSSWVALCFGILFSSWLTFVIVSAARRTAQIEKLVQERTAELAQTNKTLEVEIFAKEQAEIELRKSNEQLQQFTYIASHDLREPLRKISSFAEILTDSLSGKLDEDDEECFEFMIDGAKRMEDMIDALLTYSRITTRGAKFQPIDLNKVVEQLKGFELSVVLEEKNAILSIPEPLLSVNGDESQIRQLLQNFIANGLKYQKDGVTPQIEIRSESIGDRMIKISVKDNGIGIKEEDFDKVFVMFSRLHTRSQYEGTGIGLSVCKKIVERHGGKIGIESVYGKGTTFWFTVQEDQTRYVEEDEQAPVLQENVCN